MYDNGQWRDAAEPYIQGDQSSPHDDLRGEPPYMSGALPNEQATQESRLLAGLGRHTNASEFSFRASSPVKINGGRNEQHPVQMATEPSYLHLMDGLSRDNGVELGLKDPRENSLNHHSIQSTVRPPVSTPQNQRQSKEADGQRRWRLGHAFLHQSPNAPSRPSNQQRTSPQDRSEGFFSRAHYEPSAGLTSRAPQPQQPVRYIQNVVSSPFFGHDHHDASHSPQTRITETQPSSHRSAVCQSQRYPTSRATAAWHKPPSLDELSFVDAPLGSRNESITHKAYQQPSRDMSPQIYGDRHLSHPNTFRTSVIQGSGYGPSTGPSFSRQQHVQSLVRPQPFFSYRVPPSRIGRLPSSMPSIVSSHSPVRHRTHWETLERAGVRSSRQTFGRVSNSPVNSAFVSTTPFSRVERRSVRR
jgi:hypothetical protein